MAIDSIGLVETPTPTKMMMTRLVTQRTICQLQWRIHCNRGSVLKQMLGRSCRKLRKVGSTFHLLRIRCRSFNHVNIRPRRDSPVFIAPQLCFILSLGNRCVRVSVFGSKSCVFLAVCGQIWKNFGGLMILGQVKSIQNFC